MHSSDRSEEVLPLDSSLILTDVRIETQECQDMVDQRWWFVRDVGPCSDLNHEDRERHRGPDEAPS